LLHWKIINAKSCLVSAKHYLDFELKEPQIDAMVDVASEEDVIDEEMTPKKSREKGMPFKDKIKEAVLAKLKESENQGEYSQIEKKIFNLQKKYQKKDSVLSYDVEDRYWEELKPLIKRRAQLEKPNQLKTSFLPSTDFSNQLYSRSSPTISNQLYSRITEGLFDRVKSQIKSTASNVGQRVKNVGAAIQGKPEDFKNPWVTSGMSKIKSKAQNFESDIKDMLNDLNILFPEEKLEKAPEIKNLINSYQNLLNSVLKANTALSKGTLVNVTNKSTSTQTTPRPATPTPKPSTPEKPSTPKSLTVKPTTSSSQLYSRPTTTTSKTSTRDEKGRFISNKK